MKDITIQGRELAVEFEWAAQGHRLTCMEYDGSEWQVLPNWNGTLCILQTEFESLASLSSDLFEDAVHAETLAELLDVEMRFYDDADCVKCDRYTHYTEMTELPTGDYICQDCEIDNDL